eukprot:jgi/Ulvmu1/7758/UM039_0066.1
MPACWPQVVLPRGNVNWNTAVPDGLGRSREHGRHIHELERTFASARRHRGKGGSTMAMEKVSEAQVQLSSAPSISLQSCTCCSKQRMCGSSLTIRIQSRCYSN